MMKEEDRRLAYMFSDVKRSTAIQKLASWVDCDLVDEKTFQEFSELTRERVELINKD